MPTWAWDLHPRLSILSTIQIIKCFTRTLHYPTIQPLHWEVDNNNSNFIWRSKSRLQWKEALLKLKQFHVIQLPVPLIKLFILSLYTGLYVLYVTLIEYADDIYPYATFEVNEPPQIDSRACNTLGATLDRTKRPIPPRRKSDSQASNWQLIILSQKLQFMIFFFFCVEHTGEYKKHSQSSAISPSTQYRGGQRRVWKLRKRLWVSRRATAYETSYDQ